MLKALRVLAGVLALGFILAAASSAVSDCAVGPFTYENCLWLQVRDALHLPQSKNLRGVTLELIGLCLLAAVFLTVRYVFPARSKSEANPDTNPSDNPKTASHPPRSNSGRRRVG